MRTIVVAGARSGIGKTLLLEGLLHKLPGWSALKITVKRESRCPRNETKCGVCEDIDRDFEIIKDRKTINQKGTDTARLKKAGAKNVIWLKSTLNGLKKGLEKSLLALKGSKGVVIEGTSLVQYIKPDLLIFIKGNSRRLRLSRRMALERADIVI